MEERNRKQYDADFKLQTVDLADKSGKMDRHSIKPYLHHQPHHLGAKSALTLSSARTSPTKKMVKYSFPFCLLVGRLIRQIGGISFLLDNLSKKKKPHLLENEVFWYTWQDSNLRPTD